MLEKSSRCSDFKPVTERRVYVLCPSRLVTGGAELLHQLIDSLVGTGREAYIAYTPLGEIWETPEEYRRYQCPVAQHVPDDQNTAIIVPEVSTVELFKFRHARHVIWWLSVDNYRGAIGTPAGWKFKVRRIFQSDIPSPITTTHLFQSIYAKDYVSRHFRVKGAMLSDYLAADYFLEVSTEVKKDVVAYNPRKGYAYTKWLIRACPNIEFLRLENMNRHQIRDALDHCSVYIDFGVHPGKDRIPREAAIRNAVVIVGKKGAAKYFEDVKLDDVYKFSPQISSVPAVKRLIEDIFKNYGRHKTAQQPYRLAISQEFTEFQQQVQAIFRISA